MIVVTGVNPVTLPADSLSAQRGGRISNWVLNARSHPPHPKSFSPLKKGGEGLVVWARSSALARSRYGSRMGDGTFPM
jgi:hypothetical protein